jgi:hypothetical protein
MDKGTPERSQPARTLRVLAIVNGPTPDAVLETDQQDLGPLHELVGLPKGAAEVRRTTVRTSAAAPGRQRCRLPAQLSGSAAACVSRHPCG